MNDPTETILLIMLIFCLAVMVIIGIVYFVTYILKMTGPEPGQEENKK